MAEVTEEDNPIYLARRVFLGYMSDVKITLNDEYAFTSVSQTMVNECVYT